MPTFRVLTDGKPVRVVLSRRSKRGNWYYRFHRHGVRVYETSGTTLERDARTAARNAVHQVARPSGTPDLAALVAEYLKSRWPNGTKGHPTGAEHAGRLKLLTAWAGPGARVPAVESNASAWLCRYFDKRRALVAAATLSNEQRVIHRFLAWVRKRYLPWPYNPAAVEHLDLPPIPHKEPTDLSYEDVGATLAAVQGLNLEPVILLILGAGVRPIGAWRTTYGDLKLKEVPARVRTFSKNVERWVPLPDTIADRLRAWVDKHPGLPNARLYRRNKRQIDAMLKKLRDRRQIPVNVTAQALRGMHTTMCLDAGFLPHQEAQRTGHSVRIAEQKYLRWKALRDKGALGKLGLILDTLSATPAQKPSQTDPTGTDPKPD